MSAHLDHRPADPELHRKLHTWVAARIISPQEADAIEDFETGEGVWVPVQPAARRVPLVTEALAYVGGALAAAAAAVLLGNNWKEFTPVVRAACVGGAAAAAFVGGLMLRSTDDPAFGRLSSVLWAIATGLTAWFTWLIAYDVLDLRGRVPLLLAGVATTVLAGALYAVKRRALQQLALLAGLLMTVGPAMPEGTAVMLAVWGVGVVWVLLGLVGVLEPARVALASGSLVAIYVPLTVGQGESVGLWLGLATGIALLVGSIVLHETLLLGFGAIGVFGYTLAILVRLFGGTAAMPIALLAVGAAVLVLALLFARRTSRVATRTGRRSPS